MLSSSSGIKIEAVPDSSGNVVTSFSSSMVTLSAPDGVSPLVLGAVEGVVVASDGSIGAAAAEVEVETGTERAVDRMGTALMALGWCADREDPAKTSVKKASSIKYENHVNRPLVRKKK